MTSPIKSAICPNCGVIKFSEEDIDNIEENGECCICESIRLDNQESLYDDEREEGEND